MTSNVLRFTDVSCGYGDTIVVRGVSGRVAPGQVLGVLGRNGVGKSTLMKALAGFLPLSGGSIAWRERDLSTVPPYARLDIGIAYAPQEDIVFGELKVEENLWLHVGGQRDDRYHALLQAFPRLSERRRQRAGSLSGGERKLLSFARTLALGAPLSMLDEPTAGVQPESIDHMAALVNEAVGAGRSFIVVEQNLTFLEAIATEVMVLDHGACVLSGSRGDFNREVLERHLVV